MHIAIIGSQSSIHIVRWANALCECGIKVHVFSMHKSIEAFNHKVNIVKLPFRNPYGYLLNIPFLKKELRKINPDLIHSFYAFGHSFLGRMTGFKPHIISVLGSDIFDDTKNLFFRYITVKNLEKASLLCSTSVVMAQEIKKYVDRKVEITSFGIDTEQFKPKKKPNPEDGKEEFIIGTVKRLEDKYGIDTLISSFAKFRKRYPDKNMKLYIVGDGSEKKKLQKLAMSLGIESDCRFIGRVPHKEVHRWIQKFDVFAALSRLDSESFGVAILEASSMEVPLIVSKAGGLPEVVVDTETGIIVPKEDIDSAAQAMEKLFLDNSLRIELGKAGRIRVIKCYNWEDSVHKMISLYKTLLGQH